MNQVILLHMMVFIFIAAFALAYKMLGSEEFERPTTPRRPPPTPKAPPKRPISYAIPLHDTYGTLDKLDKILTQLEYNSEMLEYLNENRSS